GLEQDEAEVFGADFGVHASRASTLDERANGPTSERTTGVGRETMTKSPSAQTKQLQAKVYLVGSGHVKNGTAIRMKR
ncbi:MAG: hypothetical protein ACI9QQ_002406, partial [Myxococcota bacterium]